MKKVFFIFIILFVMFFGKLKVESESQQHIYHIKYFNINTGSKKIDFEGFAFIDHMDNYGGVNLTTRIEAYSGGQTLDLGNVTYIKNNVYDYYYARCMNQNNDGVDDFCSSAHAASVAGSVRKDHGVCNNRAHAGSDCAYFNVDFTGSIDLQKVYEKFGDNAEVSFRIISVVDGVSKESLFGVSTNVCYVNGSPGMCGNDNPVDIGLGTGTIKVAGVTNKVKATIDHGLARYTNFAILGSGKYYVQNETYTAKIYQKVNAGQPFCKINSATCFNSNYYVILGNFNGSNVVSGGSSNYVIFDSWVQVAYGLKLTFNDIGDEPIITEYSCLDGYKTEINSTMNAVCDGNNNEIKTCKKENIGKITVSYALTADELANANKGGKICASSKESITVGLSDFGILIHQKGEFRFGNVSGSVYAGKGFEFPKLDYKNTFFGIYNYDILDLFSNGKKFTITWDVAEYHEPVYDWVEDRPGVREWTKIKDGYWDCGNDASHDFYYTTTDRIYIGGENISLENYIKKKSDQIIKTNINLNNVSSYKDTKPNSYESNGEYSSNLVEVAGKWGDTAGYSSSEYKVYNIVGVTPGIVSAYNDGQVSNGYKYITELSYDIDDPYIQLTEKGKGNMGDVFYGSMPSGDGKYEAYEKLAHNNYFVSLYFPQNKDFLVRLNNSYLSFINSMNWYLNGNCDIDVINKVYDYDDGSYIPKYRYRPISLSDPFPDGKVPGNWSGWWSVESNRNRIYSTYDNGFFYEVSLAIGNSRDNYLGTDSIEISDYNSWASISKYGESKFINDDEKVYFEVPDVKSWCDIGKFDVNCDEH